MPAPPDTRIYEALVLPNEALRPGRHGDPARRTGGRRALCHGPPRLQGSGHLGRDPGRDHPAARAHLCGGGRVQGQRSDRRDRECLRGRDGGGGRSRHPAASRRRSASRQPNASPPARRDGAPPNVPAAKARCADADQYPHAGAVAHHGEGQSREVAQTGRRQGQDRRYPGGDRDRQGDDGIRVGRRRRAGQDRCAGRNRRRSRQSAHRGAGE